MTEDWRKQAKEKYEENQDFLRGLKDSKRVDDVATATHEEVFAEVNCLQCAGCCKTTPAMINNKDIKRIAKHLSIPPKTLIRRYLIEDFREGYVLKSVPCTFLNADNTCQIYEVRPEACRSYPHTDMSNFARKHKLHARNTLVCPAVFKIIERLKNKL